jgi:hypothetical protein
LKFRLSRLFYAGALVLCAACGGDGGRGSMGGGNGGGGGSDVIWPERGGGTSTALPVIVRTGRIVFQSESGEACCVALDPVLISGENSPGLAVLDDLPAGPATVTVSAFATDFAPAVAGISTTCTAIPASAAHPCDPTRVAPPAYASDPLSVDILPGVQTNIGQVSMNALPFLFDFVPIQGEETMEPVGFDFTVVDAVTGVRNMSVGLEVRFQVEEGVAVVTPTTRTPERPSFRLVSKRIPVQLAACADNTASPCSEQGLGLVGFTATGQGVNMPSGIVEAHITAANEGNPPQQLDFGYPFTILPTPTPGGGS